MFDQIKLCVGAGIAAVILGVFGWLSFSRVQLEKEVAALTYKKEMCEKTNVDFEAQVKRANEAMAFYRAQSESEKERVRRAREAAAKEVRVFEKKARDILRQRPQGEKCEAIEQVLKAGGL